MPLDLDKVLSIGVPVLLGLGVPLIANRAKKQETSALGQTNLIDQLQEEVTRERTARKDAEDREQTVRNARNALQDAHDAECERLRKAHREEVHRINGEWGAKVLDLEDENNALRNDLSALEKRL